jgi:hypothetical protein
LFALKEPARAVFFFNEMAYPKRLYVSKTICQKILTKGEKHGA